MRRYAGAVAAEHSMHRTPLARPQPGCVFRQLAYAAIHTAHDGSQRTPVTVPFGLSSPATHVEQVRFGSLSLKIMRKAVLATFILSIYLQ
jgi:hypothetical protein